jgi:DNA-directed RNA polymerase subunit K/omega
MDEATAERLARKVGGRFKLATLVMKRLIEINRGSQPLVEVHTDNLLDAVMREVDLDLVRLVPRLPAPGRESMPEITQSAVGLLDEPTEDEAAPEAEPEGEAKAAPTKKPAKAAKAAKKATGKKAGKKG